MKRIKKVTISQEEDLARLHSVLGGFIFRGHEEINWPLTSSLERVCDKYDVSCQEIAEREQNALFEFQRRANHHLNDYPDNDSLLEWLALMQHHGVPTRLVDVTHSIFVAAFFAVENASGESVIWAFNSGRLTIPEETEGPRTQQSPTIVSANRVLGGEETAQGVNLIKPFRLNRRLSNQQGAFLMPMSVDQPFGEQLASQLDVILDEFDNVDATSWSYELPTQHVVQIVIPKDLRSRVIRLLSAANVNAVTLFGGLDGFARSLKTTFRAFD